MGVIRMRDRIAGPKGLPLSWYSVGAAHEVSGKALGKRENIPAYFVRGSSGVPGEGTLLVPPNLSRTRTQKRVSRY